VVIQVKSRDAGGPTDEQRERNWVDKQVAKALRQAKGTVRLLRRQPVDLVNGRGRVVTVDGKRLNWTALIVIDHDDVPVDITPLSMAGSTPAVVLLRRDWEFLFDQLQSTDAVVHYLTRCAGQPSGPLRLRAPPKFVTPRKGFDGHEAQPVAGGLVAVDDPTECKLAYLAVVSHPAGETVAHLIDKFLQRRFAQRLWFAWLRSRPHFRYVVAKLPGSVPPHPFGGSDRLWVLRVTRLAHVR